MEFSIVYFDHWVVTLTVFMIYMYTRILKAKYTHFKIIAEPNFTDERKFKKKRKYFEKYFSNLKCPFQKCFDPSWP